MNRNDQDCFVSGPLQSDDYGRNIIRRMVVLPFDNCQLESRNGMYGRFRWNLVDYNEQKESTSRALVPHVPPITEQMRLQYEDEQLNVLTNRTLILYDDLNVVRRTNKFDMMIKARHFRHSSPWEAPPQMTGQLLPKSVSLVMNGLVVDQQWHCEHCHELTRWGPKCLRCMVDDATYRNQKPGPK